MRPASIIAEPGVNDTGDLDKALRPVDAVLARSPGSKVRIVRRSAPASAAEFARLVEDSAETALGDNLELLTLGELNIVRLAKDEPIP